MMKAYWAEFKDAGWGVVIVASSWAEAKRMAWPALTACDFGGFGEFIDVRVHQLRTVQVPERFTQPEAFSLCDDTWMCNAWRYDDDFCSGCVRRREKRREDLGE